ncbi:unnamed protein product [Mytilus coruscus]|uniref:Uncharacterized protein n=1 Tax=Mytilus coruscus TaxID=42192 RepID=A0A6J8E5J2_MYTCO|nr:unnamed protein product [Mytilus coruscus]
MSKPKLFRAKWRGKLESFLEDNSRIMPNKKDTVLIDGEQVSKRHLLCSKRQTYEKFIKQYPSFNKKFITFIGMIPKNYKRLDLTCRRVCVCMKYYNLEQIWKVESLNKLATSLSVPDLKVSVRKLSQMTLCPYETTPARSCIDISCASCSSSKVGDWYEPLQTKAENTKVKYHQWETIKETYTDKKGEVKTSNRWAQVQHTSEVKDMVEDITASMINHTTHEFRADFQHRMQSELIKNLPMDQCLVVVDFSENITLFPQDEIESAHWTQKQATLHPVYIVRHDKTSTEDEPVMIKESLIILSDHLTRDSKAVFVFTEQLLIHLKNNPGSCPITLVHRFSDNCATQYNLKTPSGIYPA